MAGFNLDEYVPVAERIAQFWEKHPDGAIHTEMVKEEIANAGTADDPDFFTKVIFKAIILVPTSDGQQMKVLATGYAMETDTETKIAKYFENGETSAIGRALANANFGVKNSEGKTKRPSREEMDSVNRVESGVSKSSFLKRKK